MTSSRLLFNTTSNIAAHIVQASVALFMVPFFIRTLGSEQYGIWILLASIFAYRNTLNMGLNSAINRYVPVFLVKKDNDGIQTVINMSLLYLGFISTILVITTLVLYKYVNIWFSIPPEYINATKTLVLVVGFSFVIIMPLQIYSGILSGLQRYDLINIGTVLALLARTLVLILLLLYLKDYGLLIMGLAYGLCEILLRFFQAFYAMKLLPNISVISKKRDFSLFREMIHYGANTLLYTLGIAIVTKASDIIIGIYLSTEAVSRYYIASAGILALGGFIESFTAAIKPAVSDLDARDKEGEIKQIAFLTQKYVLILLIPSTFFFIIMGGDFLRIWVGPEYVNLHFILILLIIGHFARLVQYSNFLVLVGKGQHRIFGILAVIMAVLTILLAILFVKTFKMGLTGIALSNLFPMLLVCGLILPIYFNRKMKIFFLDYVQLVWRPALFSSLPALLFIAVWKYYHSPDSWLNLLIIVICTCLVTMMCTWLWGLNNAERKRFESFFLRFKNKLSFQGKP